MADDRRMFCYVVSADDQPHVIPLTHSPVAVAATMQPGVEFWAEHTAEAIPFKRAFQVFGTGQPLPEAAKWVGTCQRLPLGSVWHLYEVPCVEGAQS